MAIKPRGTGVLIIATGGNICLYSAEERGTDIIRQAPLPQIRKALGMKLDQETLAFREQSIVPQELRVHFKDIRKDDSAYADPELLDSSQIDPKLWTKLANIISENYTDYEGFVILHGLDTMAYTASSLSFMLGDLDKPIVLTGSQRPLNYQRTDATQNIMSAITFAGAESLGLDPVIREVTVYSYDSLFRGNRVAMSHASSYRAFETSNYPRLAGMGATAEIEAHLVRNHKAPPRPILRKRASAKVHIIDVYPGMDPEILRGIFRSNQKIKERRDNAMFPGVVSTAEDSNVEQDDPREPVAGILLRTYGMGTAPTAQKFLEAIEELVNSGVLVVNVTQAKSGRVSHGLDPISLRLFEHGVVSGVDMTSEAAYAKMVVLLSEENQGEDVADLVQLDYAGEQSQSIFTFHFGDGRTSWANSTEGQHGAATAILEPNKQMTARHHLEESQREIRLIQLRILGIELDEEPKGEPKNRVVTLDASLVDKEQSTEKRVIDLRKQDSLKWSQHGRPTINIAFDISEAVHDLLSPGTLLRLDTWNPISWKRLDIVIFAETRN